MEKNKAMKEPDTYPNEHVMNVDSRRYAIEGAQEIQLVQYLVLAQRKRTRLADSYEQLRCDVNADPFRVCSRCKRLKLECRIDANFKRIGKRTRNAEMEREISDLRRRLAEATGGSAYSGSSVHTPRVASMIAASANIPGLTPHKDRESIANSLLDLRRGGDMDIKTELAEGTRILGITILDDEQIRKLFAEFFRFYHPFLPVLEPEKPPDHYYDLCPLLFWTVILVASRRHEDDMMLFQGLKGDYEKLIWSTIGCVPQNYHVVKALALLCTWPLPTSSTSSDQTFILSGVMRQIALQAGLHRPSHVQDFSRNKIELRDEEIQDRLKTWAVCNIVSQHIATAYGQPSETFYDWTLTTLPQPSSLSKSPLDDIYYPLQIERFVDKVSRKFYNNSADPLGVAGDQERATWISLLIEDYRELEGHLALQGTSIEVVYLRAAGLQLRLSAFFDNPTSPNYITDLLELYNATVTFLRAAFDVETAEGPVLRYASRHIVMMILAAGFALMKLLNSFFARHIDVTTSKALFSNSIRGIRSTSITNNDLPARLAEVLAQLWHSYGAGMRPRTGPIDASLQLKVKSRMSMSLVYDSVWRWREEFQFKGDGTTAILDSAVVNNPTQPDVASEHTSANNSGNVSMSGSVSGNNNSNSNANNTNAFHPSNLGTLPQQNMQHTPTMMDATGSIADASVPSAGLNDSFIDHDYNLFDPLAFMLDAPTGFEMGEDWGMDMHMQLPFS